MTAEENSREVVVLDPRGVFVGYVPEVGEDGGGGGSGLGGEDGGEGGGFGGVPAEGKGLVM